MIHPAARGAEALVLDQRLIHDGSEVGAVRSIAALLRRLSDVTDLHGLAALEDVFERLEQALVVARPRSAAGAPAAAAPAGAAAEPADVGFQFVEPREELGVLALLLVQLLPPTGKKLLQLRDAHSATICSSSHVPPSRTMKPHLYIARSHYIEIMNRVATGVR